MNSDDSKVGTGGMLDGSAEARDFIKADHLNEAVSGGDGDGDEGGEGGGDGGESDE